MVESVSRNQNNVVLAASLSRLRSPTGFSQIGRNEQTLIPGFSSSTADFLFQPIANVIDQQNILLEQRIFDRLKEEPERVDARSVQNRLRFRDRPENEFLRRSPDKVLRDLQARFGISSDGPRTPFESVSNRPKLNETFATETAGLTLDNKLTQLLSSRVAIAGDASLNISDLVISDSATAPDKVLVRLSGSVRTGEDNDLVDPTGRLFLNGSELAGGQVHELTLAEFQSLQYEADEFENLDYLSVVGVDTASGTRGELVTTAITTSSTGVERFIRDGLERYEFIANTEANVAIPRVSVELGGTFINGDALSDINAGLIQITVNQVGNTDNTGTNLLQQSSGNSLDVSFGSSPPVDGVVVNVKLLDPTIEITDIKVTLG
ncbi:hypothetical protein EOI86_18095 [Hwanghaeella grinnelliae]|uniref:Uncharacterized protein n=1 Tax=Hwanghaeella grinnelliae TaxID=2500179 RepID=A0A437QJS8_9PROT|nr:hypothetical protein [Hwanghaeella grinnelliae]RVU34760.1 hypothetical protein EOI86_18095 [Hwanghaeella grinnelliae]